MGYSSADLSVSRMAHNEIASFAACVSEEKAVALLYIRNIALTAVPDEIIADHNIFFSTFMLVTTASSQTNLNSG